MSGERIKFPSPYTIIFILTVIAAICTYIFPTGRFDYQIEGSQEIVLAKDYDSYSGEEKLIPQPNTYTSLPSNPQGISAVFLAPIKGFHDSLDIIIFILSVGMYITIVMRTGAIDAGLNKLIRVLQGREFLLIVLIVLFFSIGGTVEGMQEETVAFFPILIPILVRAGYDPIIAVAAILVAAVAGIGSSLVNPFATMVAAKFLNISIGDGFIMRAIIFMAITAVILTFILLYARKIKKNQSSSLVYESLHYFEANVNNNANTSDRFSWRYAAILILFFATFITMIIKIIPFSDFGIEGMKSWGYSELSALFLASGLLIGVIARLKESVLIESLKQGLSDFMPVAFVVALSRGITIILKDGLLQDTLLNTLSGLLTGISPIIFIIFCYFIFMGLTFVITSTSALATLTMPIIGPLATQLGVPLPILITSYTLGLSMVMVINPADAILNAALTIGRIPYSKWLTFIKPLIFIMILVSLIILVAATLALT